jgi:hypothetical protein
VKQSELFHALQKKAKECLKNTHTLGNGTGRAISRSVAQFRLKFAVPQCACVCGAHYRTGIRGPGIGGDCEEADGFPSIKIQPFSICFRLVPEGDADVFSWSEFGGLPSRVQPPRSAEAVGTWEYRPALAPAAGAPIYRPCSRRPGPAPPWRRRTTTRPPHGRYGSELFFGQIAFLRSRSAAGFPRAIRV